MKTSLVPGMACALTLSCALPAAAGTTIPMTAAPAAPTATTDGWQWRFNVYGWLQALEGDITVRNRPVDVNLGFDDILDNLDAAFMLAAEASYGRWSLQADLSYAEISGSTSTRLLRADLDMKQLFAHGIVAYSVIDDADSRFQVYGGVRVNSLEVDLDVLLPRRTREASGRETWVDPIIGARYERDLGGSWFFRALGDMGGFGIASEFTWQALAGIGYRFNDWSSVMLGYRGIGTDYEDGGFAYDAVNHGPLLGLEFRF